MNIFRLKFSIQQLLIEKQNEEQNKLNEDIVIEVIYLIFPSTFYCIFSVTTLVC